MASRAPDKVPRATLAVSAALVAVPDHAPARRAPAVRLLIALTRPRPGFTTHVALARQIAVRAQDRLLWMESVAQELGDSGVDHDIFPTTCRGSRFAVKHGPRVGDQANRLTRQHGTSLRGEEIPGRRNPPHRGGLCAARWGEEPTRSGSLGHPASRLPSAVQGSSARSGGIKPLPEAPRGPPYWTLRCRGPECHSQRHTSGVHRPPGVPRRAESRSGVPPLRTTGRKRS